MSRPTTSMAPLVIPGELREIIASQAEREYPHECCGALLGRAEDERRMVEALLEIENQWDPEGRRRRFLITPQEFMRVEREADERGLVVLGFYHSHPDAEPRPSEFDREHAWPWYAYPIAGVRQGKLAEIRAWQLRDNREGYDEIELHFEE